MEGERLTFLRHAQERHRLEHEAAAQVEATRQSDLLKAREAKLQRTIVELEAKDEVAKVAYALRKERVAAQHFAVARQLELLSTLAHPRATPQPA